MNKYIHVIPVIMMALLFAGCATIGKRTDIAADKPRGLYPATRADIRGTGRYWRNEIHLDPFNMNNSRPNVIDKILWTTFAAIDLPISLATDTIGLPWDLAEKYRFKHNESSNKGSRLSATCRLSLTPDVELWRIL
jgi:uncharacterized protein YceK